MFEELKAANKVLEFSNFLHPGLKGTIIFSIGLYSWTIDQLVIEGEGTLQKFGLDHAIVEDFDDE
jgi:hypothetical protein